MSGAVKNKDEIVGHKISSAIKENPIIFGTITVLYVVIIGLLIVLFVFTRKRKWTKRATALKKRQDAKKTERTETVQNMGHRKLKLPDESDVGTTQVKTEEAEQRSNGQPMQHKLSQYAEQLPNKSNTEFERANSRTSGEPAASSFKGSSSTVAPSFVTSLEPHKMPKKYFLKSHPDQFRPVKPNLPSKLRPRRPKSALGLKFILKRKYGPSGGRQAKSVVGSQTSALPSAGSSWVITIKPKSQLHSSVQSSTPTASSAASKHSAGLE